MAADKVMRTTHRCRYWSLGVARLGPGGYGPTCVMIGRGSTDPPAVWFRYSPDRKGERAREHLKDFAACCKPMLCRFDELYVMVVSRSRLLGACAAQVLRHDVHSVAVGSEACSHRRALCDRSDSWPMPEERAQVRGSRAGPLLHALKEWLEQQLARVSKKSELAVAIRYALPSWVALTRYRDDGRIEIDNNSRTCVAAIHWEERIICSPALTPEVSMPLLSIV